MADLLAMLGTANNNPAAGNNTAANNTVPEPLVTLKAGKMTHTLNTANGKYKISPVSSRGQIEVHTSSATTTSSSAAKKNLRIVWRDRRSKEVDGSFCDLLIFEGDDCQFEHVKDRIFVLTTTGTINTNNNNSAESTKDHTFFWLQDVSVEEDSDLTNKIAAYVAAPASAYPAPLVPISRYNATSAAANTSGNTASASAAAGGAVSSENSDQLGNILQAATAATSSSNTTNLATTTNSAQPALTLADLQGAMAGLATTNSTTVPLTEIATPEHIAQANILSNPTVKNKLISLLPEGQQTEEHLMEHLSLSSNSHIRAALQSLSAALASGVGNEGFQGVVMNFGLTDFVEEGSNNGNNDPIQAFLECLVRQVERENEEGKENEEEGKEEWLEAARVVYKLLKGYRSYIFNFVIKRIYAAILMECDKK